MNLTQTIILIVFFLVWLYDFNCYMRLRKEVQASIVDEKPFRRQGNVWIFWATVILGLLFLSAYIWSESWLALGAVFIILMLSEALLIYWESIISDTLTSQDINESTA